MTSERDEQFGRFVLERRAELVRTARLITGGDHHLAEDLVQTTLTKLYVKWPAFRRAVVSVGLMRVPPEGSTVPTGSPDRKPPR